MCNIYIIIMYHASDSLATYDTLEICFDCVKILASRIFTDHFSGPVEKSVRCVWVQKITSELNDI